MLVFIVCFISLHSHPGITRCQNGTAAPSWCGLFFGHNVRIPRRLKLILSGLKVPLGNVRAEKRSFAVTHPNGSEHIIIDLSKAQTHSQWQWGGIERGLKQAFGKAEHPCSD